MQLTNIKPSINDLPLIEVMELHKAVRVRRLIPSKPHTKKAAKVKEKKKTITNHLKGMSLEELADLRKELGL